MQSPDKRTAARALLRAAEILAWSAFFVFAAVFLALRFWLLPQLDRYQGEVTAALEHAVGLPVRIGALRGEWDGLHPRLHVSDLRVYDRYGREALVLPSVEPVVGWATLLAGELRLHSLTIDGPRLTVRRSADGTLAVAGIELGGARAGGGGATDWLLEQREIVVRNAEIEWLDESRGAPPLALRNLQFRLRNRGELHQIGLSARPPRALGAGLELRAALIGRSVTRPEAWNGRVYAELGTTDLAGWRAWVDYPVEVASGHGALRLWATFGAGKLVDATADLALSGVAARLAAELPELRLASVEGRVQARETARGYEFGAQRLALVPEAGPPLRGASFRASWEAGAAPRGTFAAETLELAPLAQLADYLPFPADLRQLLTELQPQGQIRDASFEWSGRLPDQARVNGRARFEGLGLAAWRAVPGFTNFTGRIEGSEARGTLVLAAQDATVAFPRVFPEPTIALDLLRGELSWERRPGGELRVRAANLQYANADVAGNASGAYVRTGEGPGEIDLSAHVQRADAAALDRYLPRPGIIGEKTREWLVRSIRAGHSPDTRLRLRGDLRHFPFKDPQSGEFQVIAQVRDGVLAYGEGWPALEAVEGELRFERERMELVARSARVLGAQLAETRAGMSLQRPSVLVIAGRAEGPTASFLEFVRKSPLQRRLGAFVDQAQAAGRGQLLLKLTLPIADLDAAEVEGEYAFAGNTLRLGEVLPPVERAAGTLAFTGSSLQLRNATGHFLGGPMRVIGGTQRGGAVVLSLGGRFTAAALDALLEPPWRGRLQGAAGYAGSVRIERGTVPQVALESNLAGVSIDLPPPLDKAADEPQLLRVAFLQGGGGARDRFSITLGRLLRAEVLRSRESGGDEHGRTAIAFHPPPGERLRLPERPVTTLLYGSLPHLDLDRWRALVEQAGAGDGGGETRVEMSFGALDAFGRRLEDISVKASLGAQGWSANVNSKRIAGDVLYRGGGTAKLTARMARFDVPEEAPGALEQGARRELPDLDLVAEDFGFRDKRLGRVEIAAQHEGADWRIERLSMKSPEGELAGSGVWRTGEMESTTLALDVQLADIGGYLARAGQPGLVRGGKGTAKATLAWRGRPTAIDYPSLSGDVQLHAEDGRFLEIDAGVGKLVSLMSLQMLPRRVVLDFRDVFSAGFEWSTLDGTAKIEQGVLETQDFRMAGGAADVRMQGTVDLAHETQDLRVRVVPEVGSAASTAAAVLVNPAVGLGTLLAQKILKDPLGQMFAFEYGITGGWTDPKVAKLGPVPVKPPTLGE
jgi:uncharacterized protein (TIGR02099 family)